VRLVRDDGKGNPVGVGFFQALADMVDAVKNTDRPNIQRGIKEIDAMQQSISYATARVGTDMNVVDSQGAVLDEITLRLKTTLSDVLDLDYTEAITKMNKDQLALEAAQSSFAKISKLTLFSYIN
jgi:flagellar hook-associated protein 3 FlgL